MSVRKVLENFIEHVKQLEVAEESGAKGNFSKEFQVRSKIVGKLQVAKKQLLWKGNPWSCTN